MISLKIKKMINFKEKLKDIRCFVFDIDGVMTDGGLLITEDGAQLRKTNIKDGYALAQAVRHGYYIWIISGSTTEGLKKRFKYLGIDEVHMGVDNKWQKLEHLLIQFRVSAKEVLYMGDDVPDYEVMSHCAIKTAPADAVPEILAIADYISQKKGGEGCVRDVIEQVLKVKGDWPKTGK
jgi:3-deoxy-D-manno-octulosonate 8-phosphate phosphatase (KDO 8-P phosphatase)